MLWPNETLLVLVANELKRNKNVVIRVKGGSMYPFLRDNVDRVVLQKISAENLKRGDIALFSFEGGYLLHRLVAHHGDTLLFRGDRLSDNRAEIVRADDVLAVVVTVLRDKREIDCNAISWRALSTLWQATLRIRIVLSKIKTICRNSD